MRSTLSGSRFTLWSAMALWIVGCGLGTKSGESDPETETRPRTTLVVENRHFNEINVFVLRGGAPIRLGSVTSTRRVTFDLSRIVTGSGHNLSFVADPVGADAYTSEAVPVRPGDAVEFRVADILDQSSVSVFIGANIGSLEQA